TDAVNIRRTQIDNAAKKFLYINKDVFRALLPEKTGKLESVERVFNGTNARDGYVPLHQFDTQPSLIESGFMKDYQLQGLSFLAWMYRNGMNCILGDEMGLGKTLQTLSLFAYAKETHPHDPPHLVVCPLSVLPSWLSELERWLPSFRALRFQGALTERTRIKRDVLEEQIKFDVCVTTYEAYRADHSWFKTRRWTYLVLDEGHKIKNAGTNISGTLQGLGSLYRLILTGTPIHNNLSELWALFHFLYPAVFTPATQRLFADSFDLSRGSYSADFTASAKKLLDLIMLRRTKATVELSVPAREEMTVFVPMSEAQRFWTYRLLTRMDTLTLDEIFKEGPSTSDTTDAGRSQLREILRTQMLGTKTENQKFWKRLMNLLLQLRQVCDHPYLLTGAEPEPYHLGEHIVAASTKLTAVDKLLSKILPQGERVLIFTQWTGMLDLLEDFLQLRGIAFGRLDGSTTRARRALNIKLFQAEKSPYQVFLISTKAGGLGINLTKANHVIMFDRDWNPQNDLQAIARAHRIGQTKVVKVYHLICAGSVEAQMLDRIQRKLFLSLKVMGSDGATSEDTASLRTDELLNILRRGTGALTNDGTSIPLERFLTADADELLSVACVFQEGRNDAKEGEADEEELKLMSNIAQVHSRLFEGRIIARAEDGQGKRALEDDNRRIAGEWEAVQKRARTERLIKVDGMHFIADSLLVSEPQETKKKKPSKKYEHEDWCIVCRDGGDLYCCDHCPRVFHAECIGATLRSLQKIVACLQHACVSCGRKTQDAGGMLFKCQTCVHAFCEDCLPDEKFMPIGDTTPNLLALGYSGNSSTYWIRCTHCQEQFRNDTVFRTGWEEEFAEAEKVLGQM
ncbi:P-loop containing nucleoside triphosphate hydrolase protein, partial [Vararia minispora EC-137]